MNVIVTLILIAVVIVVYKLTSRQLNSIHLLVNSNLTKVSADLEIALDRIHTLEDILTNKK
jgi:hypothetical protein